MQTAGPFRLQRSLSFCDVGDVWSGVDDQGQPVTIAVLNERASADDRWRDAFAAAAEALGEAGADQLPITDSDHDAARPWVACTMEHGPGAAQIFVALGRRMEPAAPSSPAPAINAPVSGTPATHAPPVSGAPATPTLVSGVPAGVPPRDEQPPTGSPGAPRPAQDRTDIIEVRPPGAGPWELPPPASRPAGSPHPAQDVRTQFVPLVPARREPESEPATVPFGLDHPGPSYPAPVPPRPSPAGLGQRTIPPQPDVAAPSNPAYHSESSAAEHFAPVSGPRSPAGAPPVSADPFPVSGGPENWQRSRIFGDQPPPKPKRNLLLPVAVALVALLIGAGGGMAVTAARGAGDDPEPRPTRTAPLTPEQLLLPAAPPAAPGVEPPQGGGWPSSWPVFTSSQSTRPITDLDDVGFNFRVPPGWSCTKEGQAAAAVRYRCGQGQGAEASGGDLIVRTCEPLCGAARRTELRQQEEAWGLRWTRSGPFTTWAETTEINGKRLYGLVYVAFWRSTPEGPLDRQLVLRMTTPLATSDDLKRVANSIRDSTFTL